MQIFSVSEFYNSFESFETFYVTYEIFLIDMKKYDTILEATTVEDMLKFLETKKEYIMNVSYGKDYSWLHEAYNNRGGFARNDVADHNLQYLYSYLPQELHEGVCKYLLQFLPELASSRHHYFINVLLPTANRLVLKEILQCDEEVLDVFLKHGFRDRRQREAREWRQKFEQIFKRKTVVTSKF